MKRVLVTRPADQFDDLRRRLAEREIVATGIPTVSVVPIADDTRLTDALATLEARDGRPEAAWLVLTSANGARAVLDCLRAHAITLPPAVCVAAVGPATAGVLEAAGQPVHHVPADYLTVAIAEGLGDVRGRRVVLARADLASEDLSVILRARGALVEEVVAYRTIEGPAESREPLERALQDGLDGITFTSGSTVRGLLALLGSSDLARATALPAFCIGPVTADAAQRAGFQPAAIAAEHTAAGLADAIAAYFGSGGPS